MTTTIPVVEDAFPPSPLRERLDEPDWTESGTNNGRIAEHYAHLRENYTRLRDEHTRLREEYRRLDWGAPLGRSSAKVLPSGPC